MILCKSFDLNKLTNVLLETRVGRISGHLITGQIPDIEINRPNIRQFNLLYLTIKIPSNKQTKAEFLGTIAIS